MSYQNAIVIVKVSSYYIIVTKQGLNLRKLV